MPTGQFSQSDIDQPLYKGRFTLQDLDQPSAGAEIAAKARQSLANHPNLPLANNPYGDTVEKTARTLSDVGNGMVKGAGNTVSGVAGLVGKIPVVGQTLSPSEGTEALQQMTRPTDTAQKIGYYGEQAAEFLMPGEAEEAAAVKLAEHAPQLGKLAFPAAKVATGALASGIVNKAQGGEFGTGAIAGAGSGALSEAGKAIAPSVAEGALGIARKARMYGKTPGEAVLAETSAIQPAKIAEEARNKSLGLTGQLENAAARSTAPTTAQPAVQVVEDAMRKAQKENSPELFKKLDAIRDRLLTDQFSNQPFPATRTATDILNAKRGIGDLVNSWTVDERKGVQKVLPRVYRELDNELDRAVPESQALNQRISSLIPASKRAQATAEGAGIPQRVYNRVGRATGALTGAGIGTVIGQREGGTPGAIMGGAAGLVLPELLSSPTAQMAAARGLNSPVEAARIARAAALQADRNKNPDIPSYDKGGEVQKTGPAIVHKGEVVIPKHVVKKFFIPRSDRKALADRGHSEDDIDSMLPDDVEAALSAAIKQVMAGPENEEKVDGSGENEENIEKAPVIVMHTSYIGSDPERLQFRSNVRKSSGASRSPLMLWKDRENGGKMMVVDGHSRLADVQRTGQPKVEATVLDVPSAHEAQAVGALKNMVEGTAQPADIEKFLAESGITPEELEREGIHVAVGPAETAKVGITPKRLSGPLQEARTGGKISRLSGGETASRSNGKGTAEVPSDQKNWRRLSREHFRFPGGLADKLRDIGA